MLNHQIYDTATLLAVLRDPESMAPPLSYWRNLCYPNTINFDDEYIDFSKIAENRKLAPLVVPTAQGLPLYSAAERVSRVKPAYVKPKDTVSASRMIRRAAGRGELASNTPMAPLQRYNAIVADIMRTHRYSIERLWEWLAAQATIYGQVTLEGEAYPRTVIDFERDAGNTAILLGAARWGQPGVSILGTIETWRTRIRRLPFGGPTNRLTVTPTVWDVMRADAEIKALLKTDYRPQTAGGLELNLGVREGELVEWVGRLSNSLDVYVYSDYYQLPDGTVVPIMDEGDVVLTGPNVAGAQCFGAIQDKAAQWQSLPIFPKMWDEQDPSATFIMNQSAPLMVPVNPNNTFRARVI